MTALKWITTEAKKLKKQYPKRFATWREYVAQASAIYASKHKGKTPVKKKPTTKKGEYIIYKKINQNVLVDPKDKFFSPNVESAEIFDLTTANKLVKKIKGTYKHKIGAIKKKTAPKKKAAAKSYHKDTQSHNVKISVMSGAKNTHYAINLNEYNKYKKLIEDTTKLLHDWEWRLKNEFSADEKKAYRHDIKIMKAELKEYKFLMNYHKKHIKAKL